LAQVFTSILVRLQTAELALLENPAEAQTYIEQTCELTRQGLAEARRSVHALRPKLLEGGLAGALAHCLHQMTHCTSVQGSFHQTGQSYPLPSQLELELFRIGQESITNACKHAYASEIHVDLSFSPQRLQLSVQDNGQGFPLTDSPESKGFGLIGMHERAQRIGGQLTIASQPQQGTQVLIIVDVATPPEGRLT
jgi:signal transduction histidine kinase